MIMKNRTVPKRARAMTQFVVISLWCLLLAPSFSAAQQTPQITFQLSPFSIPGSVETVVNGTDNTGNMVGWFTDQQGVPHGYLYTPTGQLTVIDHPNFLQTVCYGVVGGTVVGSYITQSGRHQAFYYSQGMFVDLSVPGAVDSIAYGINDKGTVVGGYLDKNNVNHAFDFNGLRYKKIDVPGMVGSTALAINHSGLITFSAFDSNFAGHGFLKKGRKFTQIDAGPDGTALRGISDTGDIAVTYFDRQGMAHGALLLKTGWYFYDQPQSFGTWLTGVNRGRNVVGYFQSTDNQSSLIGLNGSYLP